MRRFAAVYVVLAVLVALSLPALAEDTGKKVSLTGWITCDCCAAKNANAEGKGCTVSCAKNGAALVLFSDGKSYQLSDRKAAMDQVGHEVVVTGTLGKDDVLKVEKIAKAQAKA